MFYLMKWKRVLQALIQEALIRKSQARTYTHTNAMLTLMLLLQLTFDVFVERRTTKNGKCGDYMKMIHTQIESKVM